jgi:hypothetical protein
MPINLKHLSIGTMKLHDINPFDGSYIYSTSYRFCFPFTFACIKAA